MLAALCTTCMHAISNLNNTITYEVGLAFEVSFVSNKEICGFWPHQSIPNQIA